MNGEISGDSDSIKAHDELSKWDVLNRDLVLNAEPWLKVFREKVKLSDGRIVEDFYQIEQPDYAEIIAVSRDFKIIGLWRYKHGAGCVHLGLPAGYIEDGESPLSAAKRELHEECGLISNEWEKLGEFILEGNRGPAKAHIFMAEGCISAPAIPSDDLEETKSEWLSIEEWMTHLKKGNVAAIGAAVGILLSARKLLFNGKEIKHL